MDGRADAARGNGEAPMSSDEATPGRFFDMRDHPISINFIGVFCSVHALCHQTSWSAAPNNARKTVLCQVASLPKKDPRPPANLARRCRAIVSFSRTLRYRSPPMVDAAGLIYLSLATGATFIIDRRRWVPR
jgi:hypothetical protein